MIATVKVPRAKIKKFKNHKKVTSAAYLTMMINRRKKSKHLDLPGKIG